LFEKGIGQSGSATAPWAFDLEPEYHAKAIAAILSCDNEDHLQIVECLRKQPIEDIFAAYKEHRVSAF
jgi:hypothetical protein